MVRELSELIQKRRIKDDRIGFVSVTGVRLASDFSYATVLISPFGTPAENEATWIALITHLNYFQATVSRNLRLRQTPKLRLEIDSSIKEGDRIIDLIESQ